MISAAEARELANDISQLQLEEIERGIKQTIILGGHAVYYTTDKLEPTVADLLINLGYRYSLILLAVLLLVTQKFLGRINYGKVL